MFASAPDRGAARWGAGDARRFAAEAAVAGVDRFVLYGGDGTVMEAAGALAGTDVPLGIVPGGSANVFAVELGIPPDVEGACALACGEEARTRRVDLGRLADGRGDLLASRAGMGFDATMVRSARRGGSTRAGIVGYWLSAARTLRKTAISRYRFTLDGQKEEAEGILTVVTNVGNVGRRDLRLAPEIDIDDGLLDVVVWGGRGAGDLLRLAVGLLAGHGGFEPLHHWQAREIAVEADPPQPVEVDGEPCGRTPLHLAVEPAALGVLVPR